MICRWLSGDAYRIDSLARNGIITLLPLGLQMGFLWGAHPYGSAWLIGMWIVFAAWLSLTWSAFIFRETDRGVRLSVIDERIRFVLIPALMITAVASMLGYGPFNDAYGWHNTKILICAFTLIIGLKLRFIMREWTDLFRVLDEGGPNAELEGVLERSIRTGRRLAYAYRVLIASDAFLGATKPF